MEKTNNYWTDSNNNKWNCDLYTKEQAEKYSKSLVNCHGCIDCRDCSSCSYCSGCSYCSSCSFCLYCRDCRSCRDCRDCSFCSGCSGCIDCREFKSNPERITSKKIGSRNSQTTYYFNEEIEQIVCGCFQGTLQEFKEAIKKEHKNNEHSKDYFKWIEAVESYKKLTNKTK